MNNNCKTLSYYCSLPCETIRKNMKWVFSSQSNERNRTNSFLCLKWLYYIFYPSTLQIKLYSKYNVRNNNYLNMTNLILSALLTVNLNSVFRNPNISFETTEELRNFETKNQSIIPTPPHQRTIIVTKLSELQEQPCNQKTFFRRLRSDSHWNKRVHQPKFLLRPF